MNLTECVHPLFLLTQDSLVVNLHHLLEATLHNSSSIFEEATSSRTESAKESTSNSKAILTGATRTMKHTRSSKKRRAQWGAHRQSETSQSGDNKQDQTIHAESQAQGQTSSPHWHTTGASGDNEEEDKPKSAKSLASNSHTKPSGESEGLVSTQRRSEVTLQKHLLLWRLFVSLLAASKDDSKTQQGAMNLASMVSRPFTRWCNRR